MNLIGQKQYLDDVVRLLEEDPQRRPALDHRSCFYTMSPDEQFIIDTHPQHKNVVFSAGLSGHGFKFTSVLGEIMADLTLTGTTPLPIGFLSARRLS